MTLQRITALTILVLAQAACVSPASRGAAPTPAIIRPASDIFLAEPQFTNLNPDSVTVEVETRQSVVCAVVYGTTGDYGQIATDTDMAGGGHSAHHPTLTGLQPDTLYYARFEGVGPDGTLYRSSEYTFRTPPAEAEAAASGEANLASSQAGARIVGVSSNYGGVDDSAYGGRRAIDGSPGTQWSSDGDGDAAWIEIELAAETRVARIGFWTRTMGSSAQINSFRIVTDTGEVLGPFDLPDAAKIYYFDTGFTARRLRFEAVTSSGGNTGAVEIEVYGESPK